MNLKKEVSEEIFQFSQKNYMKKLISDYIMEKRRTLSWIVLYFCKLNFVDDNEDENNDQNISGDLLEQELKNSIQGYMCFNDLFDEGEITNFFTCLFKAITSNAKSLYLEKGPDFLIVNDTIKYIFEEIFQSSLLVNYFQKSNMNNLYDTIANIINILAEESFEENYAKLVTKYCQKYNQGNKNIVFTFFLGLNPDHFRETFNKLKIPENKNEDYYQNIQDYIR